MGNPRLPAVAANIASLVAPGTSVVHNYPDQSRRGDLWMALAAWIVAPPSQTKVSLVRLTMDLNEQFPSLNATETDIRRCLSYVTPAMAVNLLPKAVFNGLVDAEKSISLLLEKRKKHEHLGRILDDQHLALKERASLTRAWTQLGDSILEEERALGIAPVPVQRTESTSEVRRLDLKATLAKHNLGGERGSPMDAPFTVKDDLPPSQNPSS